jgi:hypothetical protein
MDVGRVGLGFDMGEEVSSLAALELLVVLG